MDVSKGRQRNSLLHRLRRGFDALRGRQGHAVITATVLKADGTRIELGQVAEGHIYMTPGTEG